MDLSTPVWTCAVTPTCGPSQWTPPAGQVPPPHCGSQAHMDTPVQPDTDIHRHTLAWRLARRYWAQTPRPRLPHPPGPLGPEPPLPRSHVGGTSVGIVLRHTPSATHTHTHTHTCAHTHVGVQPGLSAHSNPRCHGPLSQGLEEAPWQTSPLCICLALLSPKSQGPKPLTGLCVHFLQWQQAGGLGTGVCFSTILEPRCWESRCGQGHAPRGSRGGSSLSLPVSGGPGLVATSLISPSTLTWLFSASVCPLPFYKDPGCPPPLWPHLNCIYRGPVTLGTPFSPQ